MNIPLFDAFESSDAMRTTMTTDGSVNPDKTSSSKWPLNFKYTASFESVIAHGVNQPAMF